MPNSQHVTILKEGARAWNAWRRQNPSLEPQLGNLKLPVGQRQFGSAQGGPIDLSQADLFAAALDHATLIEADLSGAYLVKATLSHARLNAANLAGANLSAARLDHADLKNARLEEAMLSGANLRQARNLTQAQIDRAFGDEGARLPAGLVTPAAWRKDKKLKSTELARRLTSRPLGQNVDAYSLLGVDRRAALPEIRAAYLKLVKELHPDGRELDPIASEQLKAVNKAYQDLKARARRATARQAETRWFTRPGALFVVAFLGSSLTLLAALGGLYLAGSLGEDDRGALSAAGAPVPSSPGRPPDAVTLAEARAAADDAAWREAEREATSASLHRYLGRYARGRHAATAAAELPAVVNTEIALDKGIDGRNGPALAAARLALRRYLDVYPGGRLAPEVERKLNTLAAAEAAHLADNAAWAEAERTGTGEALRRYLATHPSGENAGYARMALAAIEASEARRKADHAAWSAATEDGSKVGLRRYLAAYPDGDHAAYARATLAVIEASEAHVRADRTAWGRAEAEASASAFNGYLAAYPDGEHASLARQRLSGMQASATSRQAESIALIEPQPDASGDVLRRDVDPNPNPNRDAAGASANPAPLLDTTLESLEQDPLREHADWLKAQRGHTKASYAAYLLTHPNGRHAKEARANIAELQNSSAKPKPAANGKSIKQVTQVFRSAPGDAPASQKWQSADEPFIGADGRIRQR